MVADWRGGPGFVLFSGTASGSFHNRPLVTVEDEFVSLVLVDPEWPYGGRG